VAQAASIEVIIRARDEASATVARTMSAIANQAKQVDDALKKTGTGGGIGGGMGGATKMLADLQKSLQGATGSSNEMFGALNAVASAIPGPWGMAMKAGTMALGAFASANDAAAERSIELQNQLRSFDPGPFVQKLGEANQELDLLAKRGQTFLGTITQMLAEMDKSKKKPEERAAEARTEAETRQALQAAEGLRSAQGQRAEARMAKALDDARELRRLGDVKGAAEAQAQAEEAAQRRLEISREQLRQEEIRAKNQANVDGVKYQRAKEFEERRALLEQQADLARDKRADDASAQQRQIEEEAAARRLKIRLRVIDAERDVERAALEERKAAEIDAAEQIARLTGDKVYAADRRADAEIAAINRTRDAEIAAIKETTDARAAAARGPYREEEVATMRTEEQARITALTTQARTRVAQVESAREAARPRAGSILDMIRAEQERDPAFAPELPRWQPSATAQQAADEQLRQRKREIYLNALQGEKADIAASGAAAVERAEIEAMRVRAQRATGSEIGLRPGEISPTGEYGRWGEEAKKALGEGTWGKDAAKELAGGFDKAAESAGKVTTAVTQLGEALKKLQADPSFAAKLSQDLADTLQFLGARNP
jgi:hypothetical protein